MKKKYFFCGNRKYNIKYLNNNLKRIIQQFILVWLSLHLIWRQKKILLITKLVFKLSQTSNRKYIYIMINTDLLWVIINLSIFNKGGKSNNCSTSTREFENWTLNSDRSPVRLRDPLVVCWKYIQPLHFMIFDFQIFLFLLIYVTNSSRIKMLVNINKKIIKDIIITNHTH